MRRGTGSLGGQEAALLAYQVSGALRPPRPGYLVGNKDILVGSSAGGLQ